MRSKRPEPTRLSGSKSVASPTASVKGCAGGRQHLGGDVEAEEARLRIACGRDRKVASRTASKFQNGVAGCRVQPLDQPVAAEEVVFAGQIIDVPLTAVDAVHERGMAAGAHCPSFT
jgi:hypothetical protein